MERYSGGTGALRVTPPIVCGCMAASERVASACICPCYRTPATRRWNRGRTLSRLERGRDGGGGEGRVSGGVPARANTAGDRNAPHGGPPEAQTLRFAR